MRKTSNAPNPHQLSEGQGRRGNYQAFGEQTYNFVRSNQGKFAPPKKYVLTKPEKKDINARLGPPDFFPLDVHAPEDSLKQKSIIEGLIEPKIVSDEFGSLRRHFGANGLNASEVKTQLLQYVHEIEWKRSITPKEKDRSKRTASSALFPEQVVTSSQFRESWITRLAGPEGLHRLAAQVPHGFKGDPLLKVLMDCNIPILRATWFIKIIYLNMKQNRQKNPIDPTTDWTITLVRFLIQQIKDFHNSKGGSVTENGERHARPLYILKLIKWSYCEGLLDKEKFLSFMMEQLSEMTRAEDVYVILRVLIQYMEDVSFSVVHSRRLLAHINACLVRAGTRPTPLYTPVPLTRLEGVLRTIGHLFSFEGIGTRSDLLPDQLQDVCFFDAPRIVECLDCAITTADMNSVYNTIFPSSLAGAPLCLHLLQQDIGARVHLICEWAVTNYRYNDFGACTGVSILKRVAESLDHRSKLPLQSIFVEFLEISECTPRVWLLFGELLRCGLFSHDAYVRYLISRGRLESNSTPYRIVLEQLPIFEYDYNGGRRHLALHEHNQRRTILRELSTLDTDAVYHDGVIAAVEAITSCMTRSDFSLPPLEPLRVLTLHDRWAITEGLISSVVHSLTPSVSPFPQYSCASSPIVLVIQTCTDEVLYKAFYILQAVCNYRGLGGLVCWVLQHCVDEFMLLAAITTARNMQHAFVAQDTLPELLQALSHVQSASPTTRIQILAQFVFSELVSTYDSVPAVHNYGPVACPSVAMISSAVNMSHVDKELELLWAGVHGRLEERGIMVDVARVIHGLDNRIRVQTILQSVLTSCAHLTPLQLRGRLVVCASLLGYTYMDLGSVLLIEGIKSALVGTLATANSTVIANLLIMLAVRRVLPARTLISTIVELLQENARYITNIQTISQIESMVFFLRALLGHDCCGSEVIDITERCVLLQHDRLDSLTLMLPTVCRLYSLLNNGAPPKNPSNVSDRISDSIRALLLDSGLVHICATNATYIYEYLHGLDVLVRRGVFKIISTGIQQTLSIEPHTFAALTSSVDTDTAPKLVGQILDGIVNQHWMVQYGWLQLQLLLDEWVSIDSSGTVVTQFAEIMLNHLTSNWPSYVVYSKLIGLMGDAVRLQTAKIALHILERQCSEDSLAASLVELSYHIKPEGIILPPLEEEGLCNAFASVIVASLKDATIRTSYVSSIERQLRRFATGAPHLDSLDTPPQVQRAAQRSVWLRLKLLVSLYPLTRTPDLASTLVQLTSRPFISADESDVGVELMSHLLYCIASLVEESDDTTRKLSSRMKEMYNTTRLTLPPLYRATIDATLNISIAPATTNATLVQGDVASSWSLLEDYPDGPLSPSLLGGCRVDKKVPTYASQVFDREEVPIKRLRTVV